MQIATAMIGRGPWRRRALLSLLAVVVFAGGFFAGRSGTASTPAPGSDADPLVSKSYVDQYFGLVVVELSAGQRLEAAGGTELILRSGQARTIASSAGGLANVTVGKDLVQNERVPVNHLLIVPRSDGRGILAETKVFVMVRGPYTVR
jgi:hypothetical protein